VVLVDRDSDEGDGPPVPRVRPEIRVLGRVMVGLALVVLVLGTVVTGSGPHSGDADEPARFGFDPRSVSWLHADGVLLLVGVIVALLLALRLTDAPADLRRRAWFLAVVVLAQGAIGYVQYFTGLPEAIVAAHVLGACLVWVGTLRVYLDMRTRGPVEVDVVG
jgi:cytochrome c oxidase assembly protein subunit 15